MNLAIQAWQNIISWQWERSKSSLWRVLFTAGAFSELIQNILPSPTSVFCVIFSFGNIAVRASFWIVCKALEDIPQDDFVIEYVGQSTRLIVADKREVEYTKKGIGSSYLFRLDGTHVIDATKHGNSGKYSNNVKCCGRNKTGYEIKHFEWRDLTRNCRISSLKMSYLKTGLRSYVCYSASQNENLTLFSSTFHKSLLCTKL